MSTITVALRDAPAKMSSEGIAAAEQKFSTVLAKKFSNPYQLHKAYKAFLTAMDGDVPLTMENQRLAQSFHAAYGQATQIALGGYKVSEDTRFDVRLE